MAAGGAVCGGDVYDGWRCGSVLAGTQQSADLRCATPPHQPHRAPALAAPEQRAGCSATGGGGAGPAAGRSCQVSSEREVWGGAGPGHAPSPPQPSEGGQVCSAAGGGAASSQTELHRTSRTVWCNSSDRLTTANIDCATN